MSLKPDPAPADPSRKPTLPESEAGAWKGMIWALLLFLLIGWVLAKVKSMGNQP